MKKWVILFIVLSVIPMIFASENINFIYPHKVVENQAFNVTLILNNFNESNYDIKFEIVDLNNKNIAKAFYQDSWKSTTYYLDNSINLSETNIGNFFLNITEDFNGTINISVKIRKDSKVFEFDNYTLEIDPQTTDNGDSIDNPIKNNSVITQNSTTSPISIDLSYDNYDIQNGGEFDITIDANGLLDKEYDVKTYIYEDDPAKPISQIINEDGEWVTSSWYYNEFFSGPGEKSKKITMRIKESESDFYGSATIGVKIRESSTKKVVKEYEEDIEVLKAKVNAIKTSNTITKSSSKSKTNSSVSKKGKVSGTKKISESMPVTGNVIKIGTQNSNELDMPKTPAYESKNESMKYYALYFSGILVVILVVLFILRKI